MPSWGCPASTPQVSRTASWLGRAPRARAPGGTPPSLRRARGAPPPEPRPRTPRCAPGSGRPPGTPGGSEAPRSLARALSGARLWWGQQEAAPPEPRPARGIPSSPSLYATLILPLMFESSKCVGWFPPPENLSLRIHPQIPQLNTP